ncbi:hypothetical protein MRB53_007283 [Persea americana]|uniref:Uncharacterized protein n=1 Tax=Persea americana TaxID=3435 RepID=A0ACC2MIJ5_PERAE|nr:hypothetical protein MRB53_007283 [Persea americana]
MVSSPARYSVSLDVDLRTILPEWVTIGFSGATGINTEMHQVLSWEFSSTLEGKKTIDATNIADKKKKKGNIKVILGLAIPFGAVLFGLVLQTSRKKREEEVSHLTSINCTLDIDWPEKFCYEESAIATTNFTDEKKLGEGGFGSVHKGYLRGLDRVVAVKKVSKGSKQGKRE